MPHYVVMVTGQGREPAQPAPLLPVVTYNFSLFVAIVCLAPAQVASSSPHASLRACMPTRSQSRLFAGLTAYLCGCLPA